MTMEDENGFRMIPWPEEEHYDFEYTLAELESSCYYINRYGEEVVIEKRKNRRRFEQCPLFVACEKGDLGKVKKLLAEGESVHEVDAFDNTALIYACRSGRPAIVELLLANGADINHNGFYKTTPIIMASTMGSTSIVKLLLSKGAKINGSNKFCHSSLHKAVALGRLDLVKLLVCKGAPSDTSDFNGLTPAKLACKLGNLPIIKYLISKHVPMKLGLCKAVMQGHRDVVELLLSSGEDVNEIDPLNDKMSPLMLACYRNDLSLVQLLLSKGADLNYLSYYGKNAFMCASSARSHCNLTLVEYLLSQGANINEVGNWGQTALYHAVQRLRDANVKNLSVVEFLLKNGADVHAVYREYYTRENIIFVACAVDSADLMRLLLSWGANPNFRTDRETALTVAAKSGHAPVLEVLLSHGGYSFDKDDINAALVSAADNKQIAAMKVLLAAGADINCKTKSGEQICSLLKIAMRPYNDQVLDFILSCGADIHECDYLGRSLFDDAYSFRYDDVVRMMLLHGANCGRRRDIYVECPNRRKKLVNWPLTMLLYCLGELQVQLTIDQIELMAHMIIDWKHAIENS